MHRTVIRVIGVTIAVTATAATTALVGTSPAAADELTNLTVTIATPDIAHNKTLCTTSFGVQSSVEPGLSVRESARLTVTSQGCGQVTWNARVYINDSGFILPDVVSTSGSGSGNPATAFTSQSVPYGFGIREGGIITVEYKAVSRLQEICLAQRYTYTIVTGLAAPTPLGPCVL